METLNAIPAKKQRSPYWDNFKGFLIILVVIGHCMWAYRDSHIAGYLVKLIYIFHMPAFIFVSGYLSRIKKPFDFKGIWELLISYFLINTFMLGYAYFAMGTSIELARPYYSCWYLIALVVWRLTLPYLSKVRGILIISVIFAFALGFTEDIDNRFAMARIAAFYPYFIAGYLLAQKPDFKRSIEEKNNAALKCITGFVMAIVVMFVAALLIKYLEITTNDELMSRYVSAVGPEMLNRAVIFAVAALMITALILFTPKREIPLITKWGRNSLAIYLFHRVFALIYTHYFPVETYETGYIITAVIAAFIILLVLGMDKLNDAYRRFVRGIVEAIMSDSEEGSIKIKRTIMKYLFIAAAVLVMVADKWY